MSLRLPYVVWAALLGSTLLAACGTPRVSADGPPSGTYTSGKPARAVAECITQRWRNTRVVGGNAVALMQPSGSGYRLTLSIDKGLDQIAKVDAQGAGSATQLWSLGMYFGSKAAQIADVEACQ